MNRIDRLTAILIHLQSKRVVTAREIADRFDISLRTVYRDIRSLEEAGVPIGAEAGVGYFLTENYHLPPVMFTSEEAAALLFGSKLVDQMSDSPTRKSFESALFKIKSVLKSAEKDNLEKLHQYISVFHYPSIKNKDESLHIAEIQTALLKKQVLQIQYYAKGKDEQTCREVEPIGLCMYGQQWHLIAYCRLRGEYRDFRLNRIEKSSLIECFFTEKKHKSLDEFFTNIYEHDTMHKIILRVHKDYEKIIEEHKYWYGFSSQKAHDNFVDMEFHNGELNGFASWVIHMGSNVLVLEPRLLQDIVKERVQILYEKHIGT